MQQHANKADLSLVREQVGAVPDPEIPVVTLHDLGILRDVRKADDGTVHVSLTPTYSGCPATEAIRDDVMNVLRKLGHGDATVDIVLAPAWTTDWIGPEAREKLRQYGIASPGSCGASTSVIQFRPKPVSGSAADGEAIACPRCGSTQTECLSLFGSTPCKSHHRCLSCLEPFDYFKQF